MKAIVEQLADRERDEILKFPPNLSNLKSKTIQTGKMMKKVKNIKVSKAKNKFFGLHSTNIRFS